MGAKTMSAGCSMREQGSGRARFEAHVGLAYARHYHGIDYRGHYERGGCIHRGGNAWYGITPGTLVMMFTYTYTVTNQFNFINNGLQRFNRAFGDASGMAATLDEPRLVADVAGAPDLQVHEGADRF